MLRQTVRQLAVIMFTDMVGFTALAQRSEAQALRLLHQHRALVRRVLPRFGGREVKTIGDGFLIRFSSALHAIECAVAIQQQTGGPSPTAVSLRIGLHLGDIERPRRDVLGDSVNLAARIQTVAPAGGVAMSGILYEQVRNQLHMPFEFRGRVALKNVERPVALFVLDAKQIAVLPPVSAPQQQMRWGRSATVGLAALLLALAGSAAILGRWPPPSASDEIPSVAVLPLSNLGGDAGNALLADGLHDAVLTRLSGLGGLKVISRTSVLEYRGAVRRIGEIAAELGAAHVVEGTVQRDGDRLRVNVKLVEAASDRHLWAESYDRPLDDLFALQSEMADRIASEVRTVLTPEEARRLAQSPTPDAKAYQLYLRALALEHEDRFSPTSLARIESLLLDAVARDPGFALAQAALARCHVYAFDAGHDGTAERLARAQSAAQRALHLDAELPEAHLALGLYHYYGFLAFEQALVEFDRALAAQPGNSEALAYRGFVLRRLGRMPEALASLKRALLLDPRNPLLVYELSATHAFLRQDAQAERVCASLPRAVPQAGDFRAQCLVFAIRRSGNLEPAHALERDLASIPSAGPDRHWVQYELALNEGRYADARQHLQSLSDDDLDSWSGAPPRDMLLGELAHWQGDERAAQEYFRSAEAVIRERLSTLQDSGALLASRAFARALHGRLLARMGNREAALAQAASAKSLLPPRVDRFYGASLAEEIAKVHLQSGDADAALDQLEALLAEPSHTHIQDLRLQRQWAELWEHPRFMQMLRRRSPEET